MVLPHVAAQTARKASRHRYDYWSILEQSSHSLVVSAAGLSGKPSLAKCICIVALGKQQLKTRHSQNGVSPTWSDNFILDINDARSDVGFALYDFDTFLGGSRRIISDLSDEKLHDFTLKLYNRNGETIRAELKIKLHYTYENAKPISADDFDVMRVLGRGSFGKVLQVRKQGTSCVYAMKVGI